MTRPRSNRGGVLKVLLIILGVCLLLAVAVGIYVATHWKGWAADVANVAAQQMVKESGLPQDQQDTVLSEIKQLGDDFKTGKIKTEELAKIMKTISESPLLPLAGVQAARHKYIEPSDMKPEEKAAAILALQRFGRGVHEKKINSEEINDVVKPIADLQDRGRWKWKEHPTRMELDQFVANAKDRADTAKIPNEPFDLNIAEELQKAVHGGNWK